jgi:eukaryotic-like serine/threonine-protein kinase
MTAALASLPEVSQLPRSIFGYEIVDYIGEGAGSVLYVAAEQESGQLYALKHVVKRREKDERFFAQLRNEFAVSREFTHPSLRKSILCKDNGGLLRRASEAILLMELFDGTSLETLAGGDPAVLLDVFIQVAGGLGSLHASGYIHCDLKPNNILVAPDGTVKIIDFGQACRSGAVKERIQGTPDFISPEQVKCDPVTPRTDVFNLGATMYWALTRKSIPTLFTLARSQNSFLVDDRIATPWELDNRIPDPLSNLVMECIRTNPSKRPEDMGELTRRLELVQHTMSRRVA